MENHDMLLNVDMFVKQKKNKKQWLLVLNLWFHQKNGH